MAEFWPLKFRVLAGISVILQYKFLLTRLLHYTTPKSNRFFLIWQDIANGLLKIFYRANLNIPNLNIYISTLINRISLMQ